MSIIEKPKTVGDLIEMLKGYEDFEIFVRTSDVDKHGINIHDFDIELCDIGHSDKVFILGIEERER